jgi:hypothetical protein
MLNQLFSSAVSCCSQDADPDHEKIVEAVVGQDSRQEAVQPLKPDTDKAPAPLMPQEEAKDSIPEEGVGNKDDKGAVQQEPPPEEKVEKAEVIVEEPAKTSVIDNEQTEKPVNLHASMITQMPPQDEKGATPMRFDSSAEDPMPIFASILVFFSITVPSAALVLAFSAMAKGLDVYSAVADSDYTYFYGNCALCGASMLMMLLLIFDIGRWPKCLSIPIGLIPVVVFVAGSVLKGRDYPWAPMLLTLFFTPVGLGLIRMFMCIRVRRSAFYGVVSAIYAFTAVVIIGIWVYYIFVPPHKWEQATKK